MATPTGTRSDRRRERTRRALIDSTRALIAEKGVAGLRIQEITEGADVALGSFYNHFDDKDALVEAVVEESLSTLAAAMVEAEEDDPAVVVSVANRRVVRLAYEDPGFAQLLVNLNHADALFARATHPYARLAVDRGVAHGDFHVSDPEVVLTLIVGGAFALIRAILEGHVGPDADVAHAEAALRALGVDGERAREISRRPL